MNKDDKKIIDLNEEFDENILNDEFAGIIRDGLDGAFDADKLVVSEALIAKTLEAINKLDSEKKNGQTDAPVEKTLEGVNDKKITTLNEVKKTQKKRLWKQAAGIVAALFVVGVGIVTIRGGLYKSSDENALSNSINATSSDVAMKDPMESSMATSDKYSYSAESKNEYAETIDFSNDFDSTTEDENFWSATESDYTGVEFGESNNISFDNGDSESDGITFGDEDSVSDGGDFLVGEMIGAAGMTPPNPSDMTDAEMDNSVEVVVGTEQGIIADNFFDYEAYIREEEKYYEVLDYLNKNLESEQGEVTFSKEQPQYSYEIELANDSYTGYSGDIKFINVYTNAVTVGLRMNEQNSISTSLEGVYLINDFDTVLEDVKSICERKWPTN